MISDDSMDLRVHRDASSPWVQYWVPTGLFEYCELQCFPNVLSFSKALMISDLRCCASSAFT